LKLTQAAFHARAQTGQMHAEKMNRKGNRRESFQQNEITTCIDRTDAASFFSIRIELRKSDMIYAQRR
jgi:hypothetical protein